MTTTTPHPRHGIPLGTVSIGEQVNCRVCGRFLLAGERSVGLFDATGHGPYDTCELCLDRAAAYGLTSEPPTSTEPERAGLLARLRRRAGTRRRRGAAPTVSAHTPVGSAAIPLALRAFNRSDHVRTLRGLRRTLGAPAVRVAPITPIDTEIAILVVWDVAWYEYRVTPQGIRWRNGSPTGTPRAPHESAAAELTAEGHIRLSQPLGDAVAPADERKARP